jgi:hypothetical protein
MRARAWKRWKGRGREGEGGWKRGRGRQAGRKESRQRVRESEREEGKQCERKEEGREGGKEEGRRRVSEREQVEACYRIFPVRNDSDTSVGKRARQGQVRLATKEGKRGRQAGRLTGRDEAFTRRWGHALVREGGREGERERGRVREA